MTEQNAPSIISPDRQRWDQRYRQGAYAQRPWPSGYLQQLCGDGTVTGPGSALDLACGRGRNSLYLTAQGFTVDAVDVAPAAIAQAANAALSADVRVNWQCRDLLSVSNALPNGSYALILMVRFVAPSLLSQLPAALNAGGLLVVEEHLQWSEDRVLAGPTSPRFRVAPGELRRQVAECGIAIEVVDQFEGLVEEPLDSGESGYAAVSRLCIRRRST